jgi:type IV pilus assembly protein PilB
MFMSQDARHDEEQSTLRRSRILGLSYIDTSKITDKRAYKGILTNEEIVKIRMVPLQVDQYNIYFGITNTTSHQTMNEMRTRFNEKRITFAMISESGFKEYLLLHNPPKKVEYSDVTLGKVDDKSLFESVSATLAQVLADDVLAYLVKQAYMLKASDIHMENQKDDVRIRIRVDGVLHSIAKLNGISTGS